MNRTVNRAAAAALLLLGAFSAQADSRGHHDRDWRGDRGYYGPPPGHYVREYREYRDYRGGRGRDCDDDRHWRGYRDYRGGHRYWRDRGNWRHHYHDDYYRDGYRRDRVYYGRGTSADLDVVIRVPLW